ncbi:hypothetical protein F4808DRAFT_174695 [Astrocystis sublimbata]|nr:hypothetical protein F4808DRAFT_174695 [Astrocystis sublimbata]
MEFPFTTLDVFTTKQLEGNPLAVVRVPASLRDRLTQSVKQKIAKEFNLSETVFLHDDTSNSGSDSREIDIFTIQRELPFAGHPTIGTAVFVRSHLEGGEGVHTLASKAGPIGIEASSVPQGIRAQIPHSTHLHAKTLRDVLSPSADGLHQDLAIREAELDAPVFSIVKGMSVVLVPLPSIELLGQVKILSLDFASLDAPLLDEGWREGLVMRYYYAEDAASAQANNVKCLRTRMVELGFEDPATGSAATALCAYLTLTQEKIDTRFQVTQGVEMGRKSVINVDTTLDGRGELGEVYLGGNAVVVMKGTLQVDA